jgi:hypothetical protein
LRRIDRKPLKIAKPSVNKVNTRISRSDANEQQPKFFAVKREGNMVGPELENGPEA